MKFLQQPIERKLSSLLGRSVTFQRFKISPLAGKLEVEGITIAGDAPNQPLLTVQRIEAQIAVTRALAGQIVIKSLIVRKPEFFLKRQTDGALNIPKRPAKPPRESDDDSNSWEFEAQSIRIENGQFRFQDGSYIAAAEQITGELKSQSGKINIKADIARAGRRDENVEVGPITLTGQTDSADPSEIPTAPAYLMLTLSDGLHLSFESPNPSLRRAVIGIQGKLDVHHYQSALPPHITLPPALAALKFHSHIEINTRFDISL